MPETHLEKAVCIKDEFFFFFSFQYHIFLGTTLLIVWLSACIFNHISSAVKLINTL